MKQPLKTIIPIATLILVVSLSVHHLFPSSSPITKDDVIAAQNEWASAIVSIGTSATPREAAQQALEDLYGYTDGTVLFKPTLASDVPFRDTQDEALSYFVGGKVDEDNGFALAPYTHVRFETHGIHISTDMAVSMGEYFFTTQDGDEIKVEFSFGYTRGSDGKLDIILHHSSLPYSQQ